MVAMPAQDELGPFLRSRRERVSPESVGLPRGPRRRTPGLRREELAMLAGISVDYLVRLEQGRETNPSPDVLASLAKALRLEESERLHLGKLGMSASRHPGLCPSAENGAVNPMTQAVLDSMAGTPAFVSDVAYDLLAWNEAFDRVVRPTGMLDGDLPNLLRFTFLDDRARTVFPAWEAVASEQVGNLRMWAPGCSDDPDVHNLIGELTVNSPEFARLWSRHDVGEKLRGTKSVEHPSVGLLTVDFEALVIPESPQRRMVVWLPANAATAEAFERLTAPERTPLRLVATDSA
jgi:transcriptional regulator with XRE-family HTH domain